METLVVFLYLLVGGLSTMWVENLMVEQGLGDELGLALTFGDRIRSIVLWPVFTGGYLLDFIILFTKHVFSDEYDQQ